MLPKKMNIITSGLYNEQLLSINYKLLSRTGVKMEIVLITFAVVIASSVGTLTGFGTSTLLVPVLLPFYPVE